MEIKGYEAGYAAGYADGKDDNFCGRPRFRYPPPPAKADAFYRGYDLGYQNGYDGRQEFYEPRRANELSAAERLEVIEQLAAGITKAEIRYRYGLSKTAIYTLLKHNGGRQRPLCIKGR